MKIATRPSLEPLSVYAQEYWHSPAFIVGNNESLKRLGEDLIALANSDGKFIYSTGYYVAGDGEGFDVYVIKTDRDDLSVPYIDEVAREKHESKYLAPGELFAMLKMEKARTEVEGAE